jgi:hypothetical protein
MQRTVLAAQGPRRNNFAELAPRSGLDLVDPIERNRSNSSTISRILRLRIGQRWPGDGMPKWEVIFARSLSDAPGPGPARLIVEERSSLRRDQEEALHEKQGARAQCGRGAKSLGLPTVVDGAQRSANQVMSNVRFPPSVVLFLCVTALDAARPLFVLLSDQADSIESLNDSRSHVKCSDHKHSRPHERGFVNRLPRQKPPFLERRNPRPRGLVSARRSRVHWRGYVLSKTPNRLLQRSQGGVSETVLNAGRLGRFSCAPRTF